MANKTSITLISNYFVCKQLHNTILRDCCHTETIEIDAFSKICINFA